MGIEKIIKILECEKECCKRFIDKHNICHCNCDKCDFYVDEQESIEAYILAISMLKTIQGDRKIMNPTGAQNEFTIL